MLYERKILSVKDGRDSLPSFFRINKARDTADWIVSGNGVSSSSGTTSHGDDGTFGENDYACVVDFCGDPAELEKSDSASNVLAGKRIRALWRFLKSSSNGMAFPKSYLSDFIVFEINDYGYQSMSLGNYDMIVKVFDANGNKYPSFDVALIRLYSSKTAFVIVDASGNQDTTEDTSAEAMVGFVIVDFGYRKSEIPTSRLSGLNGNRNVQEYVNNPKTASPYLDMVYQEGSSFLSFQAKYFKSILTGQYKKSYYSSEASSNLWKSSGTFARETGSSESQPDFHWYPSIEKDDIVSSDSMTEELYKYGSSKSGKYVGTRVFPASITLGYSFIERYSWNMNSVRYILKVNSKPEVRKEITDAAAFLKEGNCYLWDSDFENIIFIDSSGRLSETAVAGGVAEILIPIQSLKNSGNTRADTDLSKLPSSQTSYASYDINGSLSGDFRSKTDITALDAMSDYSNPEGYSSVFHPYLENDGFVSSCLKEGEPSLSISTVSIKEADDAEYCKKLILGGMKKFEDVSFDVRPYDANNVKPSNLIVQDSIKESFSKDIIRANGSGKNDISSATEDSDYRAKENIILSNIKKLIPNNITKSSSSSINLKDCFAIAIYGETTIFGTEHYGDYEVRKEFYELSSDGIIIIPSNGYDSIDFEKSVSYYVIK